MKRFFAYATLLLLTLCLTVPALAAGPAITEGAAVTDLGGVLTAEELASLEDTAQSLADEYGCGVYALLLPDFTVYGYEDIFDFAQDVFEENALGLGDSQNGVLLAVSTETRDVSIAVHGDSGNTAFTDYGREEVLYDAFLSDFGNDDWYAGLEHYLDTCGYLLSETANGTPVEVAYVFQDFTSVPDFYRIPPERTKPFGTVHALLCAADVVHEPFCVINADDYYGIDAYRTIYDELVKLPETGKATMVGYLLKNTASLHGTVSRGVCAVEDGKLRSVREALKIQLYPDGTLRDLAEGTDLSPETVVSMNFWGFAPSIFPALREYFENFLRTEAGENIKAECLLPVMVGEELKAGRIEVSVLHSKDKWFGMTYHEDRALVAEDLKALHAAGVYPPSLRD